MGRRGLFAAVTLALFAAASCGDDKGGGGATATTAAGAVSTTTAAPEVCTADKAGGSLTFGEFLQPRTLDPANPSDARGVLGGSEMLAIYDTLLRYNPTSGKFEPRVAESFSANADASEWTIKLRAGVKFGNGDPLTSQAVKASIERHRDQKLASAESVFAANIAEIQTPDERTVVFRLTGPWGGFPWFLSVGGGMITNVNVVTQLADKFGLLPKGAGVGPYEVASFAPNEAITLQAKKDYWGGPVCIDTLRFVQLAGSGPTYDALQAGTVQVAFLRDPVTIAKARKDNTSVFATSQSIGTDAEINQRPNAPGADVRVREAIIRAIDPKVVDQRAYGGVGKPTAAIIGDTSRWNQGLKGPELNADRAKQLVQQVIGEGKWDGTVKLLALQTPPASDVALSIETQLKAVGFKVNMVLVPAIAQDRVAGNYDIVVTGVNVSDAAPYIGLTQFTSTGRNASQYKNPQYDAAVTRLKAATDDASTKAALKEIQDIWNQTFPGAVLSSIEEVIAWAAKVKGLAFSEESLVYFDKAYINR